MLKIDNFNKIIIANWKLNGSSDFIEKYLKNIRFEVSRNQYNCVIICPPHPYINQIKSNNLFVGSQDCSSYVEGSYTGETSTKILKDLGCNFCIVGHSERRKLFNDTEDSISKKIINCLNEEIIPIYCVGESLEQKENKITKDVLYDQINNIIPKQANKSNMIIAYEPLWAIGSGHTPKVSEISEIHNFIKKNIPLSKEFKVLYGGSVKSTNSKKILADENINGLLVGSASISIDEFNKILEF